MNKPTNTFAYTAKSEIKSRRIVKFNNGNDAQVVQASSATDNIFGVSSDLNIKNNEPADIVVNGVAAIEYGNTVTAGQLLTTDAQGRAVPSGNKNRTIGVAMQNGNAQDIGSVRITPSLTN